MNKKHKRRVRFKKQEKRNMETVFSPLKKKSSMFFSNNPSPSITMQVSWNENSNLCLSNMPVILIVLMRSC
jgi:hypothetical protein